MGRRQSRMEEKESRGGYSAGSFGELGGRSLEAEGRRPVGRPRKTWRRCIQEDLALMGLDEHCAEDRAEWRRAIKHSTAAQE